MSPRRSSSQRQDREHGQHLQDRRQRRQARLARTVVVGSILAIIVVGVVANTSKGGSVKAKLPKTPTTPPASPSTSTVPTRVGASVLPDPLPNTLSRASLVVQSDGSVLILGGLTSSGSTPAVLHFDPVTGAITSAGELASAVHDAAAALVADKATVFGGGSESSGVSTVQAFSSGSAKVVGHMPQVRSDLVAVNVGGHVYLLGGYTGTAWPAAVLETDDGVTFRTVAQLPTPVRYPAVAVLGSTIYLLGGQPRGSAETDVIQAIDVVAGTASVVAHLPRAMTEATAWVQGGNLYLVGGKIGTATTATISRVDVTTGQLTPMGTLPKPVADAPVVVVGSNAYLFGGESPTRQDTIIRLNPQ